MGITTIALIPLRGGSQSIPLKNIQPLAGRPMAYWSIKAALNASGIDRVFIATDSAEIRKVLNQIPWSSEERSRLEFIDRNPANATNEASTESVLLEFANSHEFTNLVLIQATSPLLQAGNLENGLKVFKNFDSVLSVVKQKRFFWEQGEDGARAVNYDPASRPRRQNFEGQWIENGAFYITSRKALLDSKCRLSGRIGLLEMPEETYFELDELSDWTIVEGLLTARKKSPLNEQLRRIKLVITDIDGVLTDGGMYYSERGDELKRFDTRDGKGFELLRQAGYLTAIMTQENTEIVSKRAQKLKASFLFQGVQDKLSQLKSLLSEQKLEASEVLYVGDDLNDLAVMGAVGFSACPKDAVTEIRGRADYICERNGGHACFREVADLLLAAARANQPSKSSLSDSITKSWSPSLNS